MPFFHHLPLKIHHKYQVFTVSVHSKMRNKLQRCSLHSHTAFQKKAPCLNITLPHSQLIMYFYNLSDGEGDNQMRLYVVKFVPFFLDSIKGPGPLQDHKIIILHFFQCCYSLIFYACIFHSFRSFVYVRQKSTLPSTAQSIASVSFVK